LFEDVALRSGLEFKHSRGDSGQFYFIESTPPGCAFLDYDNDGDLDVFLVQSGSSALASTVRNRPFCALFRNVNGTFTDVSLGSGLDKDLGYAQGVAVGDYDNDGYDDLFITAYGGNHLFRNRRGSGKFEDVTRTMGLNRMHSTGYATSAAWGDYDSDGRLDLYMCYYARWSHALNKKCGGVAGVLDYCHPNMYEPVTHRLFRNVGSRFIDVSRLAGIEKARGRGLAVAFVDYNQDGKQDIFVANDITPNMLWHNNGDGTFTNRADQAGCAYDGEGRDMASMGIAVADYNRSGRQSLYVTNFSGYPNILFKNTNGGLFEDATGEAKLSFAKLKFLSFGCEFIDYDADGWPDLITNNGHVQMRKSNREASVPWEQRKQLFRNEGAGQFREVAEPALLGDLARGTIGRGLATGDYDNDGRIDVLAVGQSAAAQLLRNRAGDDNHWVSFKTIGTRSNRNGIGARFDIRVGDTQQTAIVRGGSSYLSSSDRRVYFGLKQATQISQVTVHWPSGTRDVLKNLAADTFYTVTEGRGISDRQPPRHVLERTPDTSDNALDTQAGVR
jgi:hypothetical protein